jgi:type VI secretion system protein VasI
MKPLVAAVTVLTSLAIGAPVQAQTPEALVKCAEVENDIARLDCYDALAASTASTVTPTASRIAGPEGGAWTMLDEINPLDDSRTLAAGLQSTSTTSGGPVLLAMTCRSGMTGLVINWGDYLGPEAIIVTRIDSDEPAFPLRWELSADSQQTVYPYDVVALIELLLAADRFVVQATPYNENPVVAVFDLAGIQNAIRPIREGCGW